MVKMILDSSLRAKFRDVAEAELCDETGHTVGRFLSEEAYRRLVYDWANAQVTDQELQQGMREPGGRPLSAILSDLKQA